MSSPKIRDKRISILILKGLIPVLICAFQLWNKIEGKVSQQSLVLVIASLVLSASSLCIMKWSQLYEDQQGASHKSLSITQSHCQNN